MADLVTSLGHQSLYIVFSQEENYIMLLSDTALQKIYGMSDGYLRSLKKHLIEKGDSKIYGHVCISMSREHLCPPPSLELEPAG